ncbi:MAG: AMP-binding protein, partial [Verrucomicrobiota bacterium]
MQYQLWQSLDRAAERDSDHPAFRCAGVDLSYGGLIERADRLAGLLRERGVRRHDRVGLFMPKSLETAVSIYGILRAGAAYVPIDPAAPPERIAFLLRDCGIRHLLTRPEMKRSLLRLSALEPTLDTVIGFDKPDVLPWTTLSWTDAAA